jgi:hypothetical protein
MTVSSFFDESGKFKDHEIISIGCVAAFNQHVEEFARNWGRLLHINGLKELTAKQALNHKRPLSAKVDAFGVRNRTDALVPFIDCMRKHLEVIVGCVVDVAEFKSLPPHFFQVFGKDPAYMAFVRCIQEVCHFTPSNDGIVLCCDEDEETTLAFYRLYKQVKRKMPGLKRKLNAISFCDDRVLFGLQASDFVASLIRLDARKRLTKTMHDYDALFEAMTAHPTKDERLWFCGIATANRETLQTIAQDTLEDLRRRKLIP